MKNFDVLLIATVSFLATQSRAGNLTVNGDLTISNNLTAQSITLGGETQTNWNSLPLQGSKYVIVPQGTNDAHRGNNLRAAYTRAASLGPSASNRITVIVPPGAYNLGSDGLVMDTSYVDIIGLVPCQMTTKQVFTDRAGRQRSKTVSAAEQHTASINGTITQTVDNVHIESVYLQFYWPTVSGTNTVLRHVWMTDMRNIGGGLEYAGQYIDCVSGSWGFSSHISGTFIDCVAETHSFGNSEVTTSATLIDCTAYEQSFGGRGGGGASGTFTRCVGGDFCFGGWGNASGTFIDCVAGQESFAGGGWTASGTFIGCVGDEGSFGSSTEGGGTVSGTFIDCVGGQNSFAGNDENSYMTPSAKLRHCKASGGFAGFGASDDFNYNFDGTNTFLMLPYLPTSDSGLPSGSVWSSNGVLRVKQ